MIAMPGNEHYERAVGALSATAELQQQLDELLDRPKPGEARDRLALDRRLRRLEAHIRNGLRAAAAEAALAQAVELRALRSALAGPTVVRL